MARGTAVERRGGYGSTCAIPANWYWRHSVRHEQLDVAVDVSWARRLSGHGSGPGQCPVTPCRCPMLPHAAVARYPHYAGTQSTPTPTAPQGTHRKEICSWALAASASPAAGLDMSCGPWTAGVRIAVMGGAA